MQSPPVPHPEEPTSERITGERGATLVQYALLIALVGAVVVGGLRQLGGESTQALGAATAGLGGKAPTTTAPSSGGGGGGGTPVNGGGGNETGGGGSGGGGTGGSGGGDQGGGGGGDQGGTGGDQTGGDQSGTGGGEQGGGDQDGTGGGSGSGGGDTYEPGDGGQPEAPTGPDSGPGTVTWQDRSTSKVGGNWKATARIVIRTPDGTPVPGAGVTVTVRSQVWGFWTERSITVETDADGSVLVDQSFEHGGWFPVTAAEYRIATATMPEGYTWDGGTPSTSFTRPS